jgi:hypothetical protein
VSIVSEPWPTEHLRTVARLTAAGLSSAQIAVQLNDQGVPVPRQAVTHHSLYRHSHPYALPTDAGSPARWNAAAVAALTACPEYDAADGYAAARAKLGSSVTTTLTMT